MTTPDGMTRICLKCGALDGPATCSYCQTETLSLSWAAGIGPSWEWPRCGDGDVVSIVDGTTRLRLYAHRDDHTWRIDGEFRGEPVSGGGWVGEQGDPKKAAVMALRVLIQNPPMFTAVFKVLGGAP